jgi:SAM-dependent methyltransferase
MHGNLGFALQKHPKIQFVPANLRKIQIFERDCCIVSNQKQQTYTSLYVVIMLSFLWMLLLLLVTTLSIPQVTLAKTNDVPIDLSSSSQIESTKQFYNSHVDEYITNIHKAGITHVPQHHLETFIELIKQQDKKKLCCSTTTTTTATTIVCKILEIGCGYGRDAEAFSKHPNIINTAYIGTDYSRSMLIKAQERNPNLHFLELDMRQVASHFVPNSMDGIWACATIIHIPKQDVPALLQSFSEVLRPGGVLYVSVKQGTGESFDADVRYGGIKKFYAFYEDEELRNYIRSAGFEIVESGVEDHREKDSYATHPFIHVFARKPLED